MKKAYKKPFVQVKDSGNISYKNNQRKLKVSADMIIREVAGEHILIPVGEMVIKVQGMISLTESGILLWKKLQEGCTIDDLVNAIISEYEIDTETAYADVEAFLQKLQNIGILV